MGLSASKEFADLFIAENGPDTSESNLKKLKIGQILASGIPAPKNNNNWKNLELANNNEQTIIINLKAGARFIQQGRVNKENVLIVTDQQNNDSTAFLVAYFMLLSGLPVKCAKEAVSKLNDKVKVTNRFDNELETLRNSNTSKVLREELLKTVGTYPDDLLAEDVKKIYRLANITPPSPEEIRLEDARRISLIEAAWAKANQEKELADNVEKNKKHSLSSVKDSPSPGAKTSFLKRFSMDVRKDTSPETKPEVEQSKITSEPKESKVTAEAKEPESAKKEEPAPKTKDTSLVSSNKPESSAKPDTNSTGSEVKANADKTSKPLENGTTNDKVDLERQTSRKVSLTYALSNKSTEAEAVDEYLKNNSEEERAKSRRRVTITRALSKTIDE